MGLKKLLLNYVGTHAASAASDIMIIAICIIIVMLVIIIMIIINMYICSLLHAYYHY